MAASIGTAKLPKSQRKLVKKQSKVRQILSSQEHIEIVDYVTKILCVSNAGLDNGVSQEEVFQLFRCYGNVSDIVMLPKKPYAFVCYTKESEAEHAYTAVNGYKLPKSLERQEEKILYISYVSKAPASLTPSNQLPPGLVVLPDVVTDKYAQDILESVCWREHTSPAQQRELKHRRVKHYGYEFKYSINNVDPDDPLPEGIPQVYKRLLDDAIETGFVKHYPDQLTVNQYQPGQGIPPHVDTPSAFEDGLMSLSLGSQVVMEFRHPDGRQLSVLLPPNSLLIMTGESRYVWSHGITPRKSDIVPAPGGGLTLSKRGVRTSFTFRKITGVKHTDGASSKQSLPTTDTAAALLETHHVHQVYEEIAGHFSGTRHTPWPQIAEFLHQQPAGSVLADIGCGNGKYFGINKEMFEIGSDRSSNLAEIVRGRGYPVFVGDVLSIPLRAGSVDVCLCIAVIHHLSTHERRLRALAELLKVIRVGGKLLVYVWAMEQQLNKVKSKYISKGKGHDPGVANKEEELTLSESVGERKSSSAEENELNLDCEGISFKQEKSAIGNTCMRKQTDGFIESDNMAFGDNAELRNEDPEHVPTIKQDRLAMETCKASEIDSLASDVSNKLVCRLNSASNSEVTMDTCKSKAATEISNSDVTKETSRSGVTMESCNTEIASETVSSAEPIDTDRTRNSPSDTTSKEATTVKLEVHVNRTEFKQQDLLVPWQLKNKQAACSKEETGGTFHRYYHVFKQGELESLCSELPCKIVKSYYDQGNWAVVLEKS